MRGYAQYYTQGKYRAALEFLRLQKLLGQPETATTAFRLAQAHEALASELRKEAAGSQADQTLEEANQEDAAAADAYVRHARLATMNDPVAAGSLWHAAQLFDQAGQSERAMKLYNQFIAQRPHDPRVPEALYNIGLLHESLGQFKQAIEYFKRNIKQNPKTPSSYMSTVELARCYMAQGADGFSKAEDALLSLVQNNTDLHPTANEFRISLFTLGELYYRSGRWSDAILRLEEAISRYPNDPAVSRATFWLADCYRKSAHDISAAVAKNPALGQRDQLETQRAARLRRAAGLFSQVVARLDPQPAEDAAETGLASAAAGSEPSTEPATEPATGTEPEAAPAKLGTLEQQYLRYSYLYRADCVFELGDYQQAVKLYDQAASRFASSITAVDAYVQIVNSYLALHEPAQARAAAERARWLLKRIPDTAFGQPPLRLSRDYYEALFRSEPTGS
jgi:tetratricopeptide (TPR) repeat protein